MSHKNTAHLRSALQKWVWRIIRWSLLCLSAYGWLRLFSSSTQIKLLLDFGLSPVLPGYLQISGVILGTFSLASWFLLKSGRPAGLITTFVVVILFLMIYWIERLFVWRSSQFLGNWLFMLALSMLWLLTLWIGLRLINSQKHSKEGL